MLAKIWFPPSSAFTLGLIVLGAFSVIRSPFAVLSAVSLDTTLGTYLYLGALAVFGLGYLLAERREKAAMRVEQKQRDDCWRLEIKGRDEKIRVQMDTMLAAIQERNRLEARGVPPSNPQMQELAETVRSSAATIAGIVVMPPTGVFTITGYAPEVTISPVKSTGAQQP